jgi:hypothetical protein
MPEVLRARVPITPQQRMLREEVAAAKTSTTRARRAARMLGLEE